MTNIEQDEIRPLGDRLQDVYRVDVLEEETLRKVRSYKLTPLKMYLILLGVIVLISIIIISTIWFTPLRRVVPGYGEIKENREFVELTQQVDILKEELETQQTYTRGLMSMLTDGDKSQLISNQVAAPMPARIDSVSKSTVKSNSEARNLQQLVLLPPLRGSISAGYDLASGHLGIDILAPKDSPVVATSDGVVIQSDWTLETGNTIGIQHQGNLVTFYKHNAALLKKTGQMVRAGEAIAIIGNSGTLSDGPHLHFEMWYNGHPIDPSSVLTF
jgi:murein DD-endopeptidase MepM/ murein hydrolase activator NlpD